MSSWPVHLSLESARRKELFWKEGTLGRGRFWRERILGYWKAWRCLRGTSVTRRCCPRPCSHILCQRKSLVLLLPGWLGPSWDVRTCHLLQSSASHFNGASWTFPAQFPPTWCLFHSSSPSRRRKERKEKHLREKILKKKIYLCRFLSVGRRGLIPSVTSFPSLCGVTLPLISLLNT